MFVGCFEISISVIVKHVQSIEIIRGFFCLPGGAGEIAGFWFARGGGGGGGSGPRLSLCNDIASSRLLDKLFWLYIHFFKT